MGSFFEDYFKAKNILVKSFGSELDIRDYKTLEKNITEFNPDLVIHTAAKTNIDWCEQNKLESFAINTLGADNVGKICAQNNIYLVHISSGCVLESKNAEDLQSEEVKPSPLCFYSWTKVWAEELLQDLVKKENLQVLILRPRQLLSAKADPRNALTKLLTYDKFISEPNSCTVVEDLMIVTADLISRNTTGIFNVVNPGVTSPWEIAQLLKEFINPNLPMVKITNEELQKMTLAKRVNAVLDTKKLNSLGIYLKEIHERMKEIVMDLKKNITGADGEKILAKTKKETEEKLNIIKHN